MQMFSVNAASLLLERDRRTVTKAMAGVAPDGNDRGAPRWKMSTIVTAMERHNRASDGGGTNPELQTLYRKFDLAYDAMKALPTLEKRRAAARKLGSQIAIVDRAVRQHGKASGAGEELANMRADHIFGLCMRGFEAPCEWTSTECWKNLDRTDDAV
jgi:hypothetical protein